LKQEYPSKGTEIKGWIGKALPENSGFLGQYKLKGGVRKGKGESRDARAQKQEMPIAEVVSFS